MDINSRLYYQTAIRLGFPVTKIDEEIDGFKIKLFNKVYYFRSGTTPFNDGASISIANNKFCMNIVLRKQGFPLPKAKAISRKEIEDDTWDLDDLSFPIVAKPTMDTATGTDVLCNIKDMRTLHAYLDDKKNHHKFITLEEFKSQPNAYRVLVFFNKVIGVTKRIPASIIGDGENTIRTLIALENKKREALKKTVSLGPIRMDKEVDIKLEEMGLTLDTIPQKDEKIFLCYGCNSTRGGSMISLGRKIGKENKKLFCRAAKALNLNIVGFDVVCENINIPFNGSNGFIIEANHNPDISIHERAMSGVHNIVSKTILRRLIYQHPITYFCLRVKSYFNTVIGRSMLLLMLFFTLKHFVQ